MTPQPLTIDLIGGARPNFMKIAPLHHALARQRWCKPRFVHTGQHYDAGMSDAILHDLHLPAPDISLGVGSGTHGEQTARILIAYEKILLETPPDWAVVVGDVNSTIACALAASKLGIRVAHLEAGLRSRDRTMPEEINRLLTDAIADVLWTPSPDADENLRHEGVASDKIECVGNIMIDSFEMLRPAIETSDATGALGLRHGSFGVMTLHRPSNVDSDERLDRIASVILGACEIAPLVFPVHPRTRKRLEETALLSRLTANRALFLTQPRSYIEFMNLVMNSGFVLTDSGGVQEETTYLNIPCLTLRESTERPITVTAGTNKLVTLDTIIEEIGLAMSGNWKRGRVPDLWDGLTADRVVHSIRRRARA